MDKINEVLTPEQRTMFQPIPVPLKKGQASFHHSLTIHGSQKNRSAGPRRATIINVVRDGVRSGSDEPLLAGVPVISKGSPLRGQFFPLLFDPAAIGI
jgi:ectoine hydroxylase-related dioxygenase (phytanoyl-CoA dioxygenase family)